MSASAMGVNADGSLVVGVSVLDAEGTSGGVIWTSPTATPKAIDQASDIARLSDDGKIAVGTSSADGAGAYWDVTNIRTSATTPVPIITLTAYGVAADVSSDGRVVVGTAQGHAEGTAVRWTAGTGAVSLPHYSPCYQSTSACGITRATGVSGDGNVTFGGSSDYGSIHMAVRWVGAGAAQLLGPVGTDAMALDSNFDGSIIVGSMTSSTGNDGFVWDLKSGNMQSLTAVLATNGVALPTAPTVEARAICSNGTVIVGNSFSTSDNTSTAWSVDLTNTGVAGL